MNIDHLKGFIYRQLNIIPDEIGETRFVFELNSYEFLCKADITAFISKEETGLQRKFNAQGRGFIYTEGL